MRRSLALLVVGAFAATLVAAATASTVLPQLPTLPPLVTGVAGQATATVRTATATATGAATRATTAWTATGTHALALQGTRTGALAPSTPLHVSVALALQDRKAADAAIAAHKTMSEAGFLSTYAPSQAAVDAVSSYLASQGFTNVAATPNRLFVSADGTAAQAEQAFDTGLSSWSVKGQSYYANDAAASVPSSLGADVASVLGLTNAATMHGRVDKRAATGLPQYLVAYNPQGFWQAYDATTAPTGAKTTIAIFTEGDMTGVLSDLRAEEKANGLPQVPVSVIHTGISSPDTAGSDEWDMDTQYSTGMADKVKKLDLYTATSLTDSDLTLSFNKFAADDTAKAGSASFGECEYQAWLDGSMVAMDQVFAEAALQGQTVFASSGDTGGFCPVVPDNGVPAGAPDVNYPASSPYVVSAGGTTLLTSSDGSYDQETAWVAGGGGPSVFEYQPSWQGSVAPPTGSACLEYVACPGKTLPDIAMDADPESGANVWVDGTPEGVGGTSLSSPLSLGVWARIESAHANALGFAAPLLYGAAGSAGFHDITLGDTGPYPATPGWDFATGLGTFDVAQAVTAIH
jgi:pseudomonalisin